MESLSIDLLRFSKFSCLVSVGTFKKGDKIRVEMEAEYMKNSAINYRLVKLDEEV